MFSRLYRSAAYRGERTERRRSNATHASTSRNPGTAPAQPSICLEQTPSAGIINSSNAPMDFGSSPFLVQYQAVSLEGALAPYPQTPFGSPISGPPQELYQPPSTNQGYYATSSSEAMDYDSHGRGDGMSSSMFVSPGSPASPPRTEHLTVLERDMMQTEPAERDRKKRSHKRDSSVVFSWRYDPSDIMPGRNSMGGEYHTYDSHYVDAIDNGPQVSSRYPALADIDLYGTGDWTGSGSIVLNNRNDGADQAQEEGWDFCEIDGST